MKEQESLERLFSLIKEPVIGEKDGKVAFLNNSARSLLYVEIGSDIADLLPDYLLSLGDDAPSTMGKIGRLCCAVSTARLGDVRLFILTDHTEDKFGWGDAITVANYRTALMHFKNGLNSLMDFADKHKKCEGTLSQLSMAYFQLYRIMFNTETIKQLQEGNACFTPETIDLSRTCGSLAMSTRLFTDKRGIEMELLCPDGIIMAKVDKALIEVMTMCLITNAVYHVGKNGKIQVKIERDGNYAIITVADSGSNVPPELTALPTSIGGRLPTYEEMLGLGDNFRLAQLIAERHNGEAHIVFDTRTGTVATAKIKLFDEERERLACGRTDYGFHAMDVLFLELSCILQVEDYDINLLD